MAERTCKGQGSGQLHWDWAACAQVRRGPSHGRGQRALGVERPGGHAWGRAGRTCTSHYPQSRSLFSAGLPLTTTEIDAMADRGRRAADVKGDVGGVTFERRARLGRQLRSAEASAELCIAWGPGQRRIVRRGPEAPGRNDGRSSRDDGRRRLSVDGASSMRDLRLHVAPRACACLRRACQPPRVRIGCDAVVPTHLMDWPSLRPAV